jgi:LacI family transcriptional regulator
MNDTHPTPRVRMLDIARKLGVSQPTVSRALGGDPRISEAVRRRVQEAAQDLGYQPDPMLSALAHYRRSRGPIANAGTLAWINGWPDPAGLRRFREFDLYWQGASEEARRAGYRLEEFILDENLSPRRLQSVLLARNIRGILIPPHQACPDWGEFRWSEFCVVRFGYSIANPRVHLVTSDQLTDGLIAVESIRARGYRRIGLVTSARAHTRFPAGYLTAQMNMDTALRIPPLVLREADADADLQQLSGWLEEYAPDAILTGNAPLRDMLSRLDWRVPQDVALAALSVLDGNADAGIYQNSDEIGRAAVQLLISLIHHDQRGIPPLCREVLVEGKWQDGSTLPDRTRHRKNR